MSEATSGVGWIEFVGDGQDVGDRVDQQADRPAGRPATTMITWRAVGSAGGKPSRAARSTIGSTAPRRLMTPRTKAGECGRGVAGVQPRISRTDMMSTQNSCAPMRKAISSRPFVACDRHGSVIVVHPAAARSSVQRGGVGARTGDDRVDVEDQGDAAIAEDGRGGDAGNVPVIGLQALDDDLALALDGIDQQRAARAAFGLDQKRDAGQRIGRRRCDSRVRGRHRSAA